MQRTLREPTLGPPSNELAPPGLLGGCPPDFCCGHWFSANVWSTHTHNQITGERASPGAKLLLPWLHSRKLGTHPKGFFTPDPFRPDPTPILRSLSLAPLHRHRRFLWW